MNQHHPIQPLEMTDDVLRFKRNAIIDYLQTPGKLDLNDIAFMDFSDEDHQQLAQLIGYFPSAGMVSSAKPAMMSISQLRL